MPRNVSSRLLKFLRCRLRTASIAIIVSVMATACVSDGAYRKPDAWPSEAILEKWVSHARHWGQYGDASPNNGWSDYTRFTVRVDDGEGLIFHQDDDEFLIRVMKKSNNVVGLGYSALSLRNVGMLYWAPSAIECENELFGFLGMRAEAIQYVLSQALPAKLSTDTKRREIPVSGGPTELRFMGIVGKVRSSWQGRVLITPLPDDDIEYKLSTSGGLDLEAEGVWSVRKHQSPIGDQEEIVGWIACPPELAHHGTFGAIRNALKENADNLKN